MSSESAFPTNTPSRRPLLVAGVVGLLVALGIVAAGLTLRTADARKLLAELTTGIPEARLTKEAAESAARMSRMPVGKTSRPGD